MAIRDLLTHLALDYKAEGKNILLQCPACDDKSKHLSILAATGLGHCFLCDYRVNPYKIVEKFSNRDPAEIFDLLKQCGLETSDKSEPKPAKAGKPELDKGEVRAALPSELAAVCAAKSLDPASLAKFTPFGHTSQPWMLLPAFEPGKLEKACGWLRVRWDGAPVWDFKDKETGERKITKYPIVSGSKHGLFGLKWLAGQAFDTLIFAEAWRDCLAAISLGYAATASSGGASTWYDEWLPAFTGKTVYIIMDADVAGQRAATRAAERIATVAKAVHIVELPYEVTENHGANLCDWIVRDKHTAEDLAGLLDRTPQWSPMVSDDTAEDAGAGEDVVMDSGKPEADTNPSPGGQAETDDSPNVVETKRYFLVKNDHPNIIAEAFEMWSRQHSKVMHRFNSTDEWSIFHKGKYQLVPDPAEIEMYLRIFIATKMRIRTRKKQPDGTFVESTVAPGKEIKSAGSIKNIMFWLRDTAGVHLLPSQAAPCSLDGKMDPNKVIALENGLLDWGSHPYTLHDHTDQYYNFNYLPYKWLGENNSEMWIKFLIDATGGNEDLHGLLQQWAGYCLMKHNQKQQKFLILSGESNTGKSVFTDVLTHMLGKENISAVPLEKFDDPHFVGQTYGKMLNITDESESHIEEVVESHLKHYTGGTMFTFKKLYENPFAAYPTAKIMICTNHIPDFKDTSNAIWRRMIVIPIENVVPDHKMILGLAETIIKTEMPGVLQWALEGARRLEKYGFIIPDICKQAVQEHRRQSVPEIQFFEENFEPASEDDRVRCTTFRTKYEDWCRTQGVGVKSTKKLARTMKKMFPLCDRKRGRDGLKLDYFYYGIMEKE